MYCHPININDAGYCVFLNICCCLKWFIIVNRELEVICYEYERYSVFNYLLIQNFLRPLQTCKVCGIPPYEERLSVCQSYIDVYR